MDLNFQMQRLNANLRIINEEDEFKKMCQTRAFGTVVLENIAK
jgi:hypothetical protein